MRLPQIRKETDEELMARFGVEKNDYFATDLQYRTQRRKLLGPSWGKRRRKRR